MRQTSPAGQFSQFICLTADYNVVAKVNLLLTRTRVIEAQVFIWLQYAFWPQGATNYYTLDI